MAELELNIKGLDTVVSQLRGLPDNLRRGAIRNALAAGARIVRDEARRNAPVLRKPDPRRKPGTVRDAISVRTSKRDRANGDVGVFVNVKPLKAKRIQEFKRSTGLKAAYNRDDPYYFRWLEWGRQGRAGSPERPRARFLRAGVLRFLPRRRPLRAVGALPALGFLQRSAQKLGDALKKFEQVLGPIVQKANDKFLSQP